MAQISKMSHPDPVDGEQENTVVTPGSAVILIVKSGNDIESNPFRLALRANNERLARQGADSRMVLVFVTDCHNVGGIRDGIITDRSPKGPCLEGIGQHGNSVRAGNQKSRVTEKLDFHGAPPGEIDPDARKGTTRISFL
jgi:hypothetical protein